MLSKNTNLTKEIPKINTSQRAPGIISFILEDDIDDYTFLPIKRPTLFQFYKEQRDVFWVPNDIDMRDDRLDYEMRCDDKTKRFVEGILSFFVFADGLVCENIVKNFQEDTSFWKECRMFYAMQNAMEMIHGEMYSLMAECIVRDRTKLENIFNSIKTSKAAMAIASFMKKYMDRSISLPLRVVAFACVEGILFNSAFASVYYIKKLNILRGFCKANEFIARDEGIHTKFAVMLTHWICAKLCINISDISSEIQEIINEAIEVNILFIDEIIPVSMIGMNAKDLLKYSKCTADSLITSLGLEKIFKENNPFDWMVVISLPNKTNFFEDKVSEYSKSTEGNFVFDENAYF